MKNFIENYWYVAATKCELKDKPLARIILNKPIVLFRGEDGKVGALDDTCAHRLAALSLGKIVGNSLECGYHGWTYNSSGKCIKIPGTKNPGKIIVNSYPVAEKWGWVFIWLGNPDNAQKTELPDFHVMGEKDWVGDGSLLNVMAHCNLIRDNLLDLTHAKYTHQQTLATDEVDLVPIETKREGDMVSIRRVMKNINPSPFFAKAVGYKEKIIHRQTTEYTPGCNIVIRLRGSSAANTTENLQNGFRVINAITPETDTSSHYFWWLGRNYNQNDSHLTQWMKDANARTFLEDKVVLEAQQKNIILNPHRTPIPSPSERGLTLADTLYKELSSREASQ